MENSGIPADGFAYGVHELQFGSQGQCANLRSVAIEQTQAFDTGCVQMVINVPGQITVNIRFCKAEFRRPLARNCVQTGWLESVITRIAEDGRKVESRVGFFQRVTAYGPEGKDERLAGVANPFFCQVERVITCPINLEGGVSNYQAGITLLQHLLNHWLHRGESASAAQPLFEDHFRERYRRHR